MTRDDGWNGWLGTEVSRRRFLGLAAGAGLAVAGCSSGGNGSSAATTSAGRRVSFSGPPFTLGVASGDPLPNGVVLWTRAEAA
jgi:alkaline phosphatase D